MKFPALSKNLYFKKIAYKVGDLFEMLTFDGNQKLDCENTGKQCIESFEIENTRKNREKKFCNFEC